MPRARRQRIKRFSNERGITATAARRLFPGLRVPERNLISRAYTKAARSVYKLDLRSTLRALSERFGRKNLKVLELGAGSARLSARLFKQYGLRPENYVIGDLDYAEGSEKKGPFLVREVHELVKKGIVRKFRLDVLARPPEGLGKFHLIMLPNVRGDRLVLGRLFRNYLPLLEKNGIMALNRVYSIDSVSELLDDFSSRGIISFRHDYVRSLLTVTKLR